MGWFRKKSKTCLFYRRYHGYTGGHQKVADYVGHTQAAPGYSASIAFSDDTLWDENNPWLGCKKNYTV